MKKIGFPKIVKVSQHIFYKNRLNKSNGNKQETIYYVFKLDR